MIELNISASADKPFILLKNFYDLALSKNQPAVEAIVISSISVNKD